MEYEMRISDWSSKVCSSDLRVAGSSIDAILNLHSKVRAPDCIEERIGASSCRKKTCPMGDSMTDSVPPPATSTNASFDLNRPTIVALLYLASFLTGITALIGLVLAYIWKNEPHERSEEHTSELQSLMRISYAVFCLKKKNKKTST